MTLLSIITDAADEIGIDVPATIIANPDDDVRKLLRLTTKTGRMLLRRHTWQAIRKEHTFTALGVELQTAKLPSDFNRFVPETFWNRTDDCFIPGPVSATAWQGFQAADPSGQPRFIYRGGAVSIYPAPDAGDTMAFEYASNNWIDTDSDGIGDAGDWAADGDTPLFDEDMMTQGLIFQYLNSNDLPTTANALAELLRTMKALIRNDNASAGVVAAGDIFAGNRHSTGEPTTGPNLLW